MAKKPGYYSAGAIIGRAKDQAARLKQQEEKVEKNVEKPTGGATSQPSQTQVKPIDVSSVFTPSTGGMDWDWKTAKTDMQGRPIESRNFMGRSLTPKGFDPNGNPYFGEGLKAWLSKWAYKISEESATKGEAQSEWQKFAETSSQYSALNIERLKSNDPEERKRLEQEGGSLFLKGAGELWNASTKWIESQDAELESGALTGGFKTPLTYVLRSVNAAVGMTLEAFQWVSEVPEKSGGALRAMREYATAAGSTLPELTFDPAGDEYYERIKNDPKLADNGFKANSEAADFLSRLMIPGLSSYDAIRFIMSPGDFESKKKAVQGGWIEGRMLYTEILKEGVRQEYISRVKAGEDPGRLVMELEDPWIELGGELLLDPLNVFGLVGKAKRAGDTLMEAGRVVENSGLLVKPEFVDSIQKLKNMPEADALNEMKRIVSVVKDESALQARRLSELQQFGATSYLPSANKIVHRKVIGNHISAITQAVRSAGGTPDDVLDYVAAIQKITSGDELKIMDGMSVIKNMPVQFLAYNDSAFEVGYMLNKIMSEGDIINDMEKLGGNFPELAKYLDTKIEKAMDYAFPSVMELQRADNKLQELKKAGDIVDANTQRLSDAFNQLKKEHPGYVKWGQFQDLAEKTLKPINGFLANNYFSLSYGYAFRNFIQNMFTLWVDGGIMLNKEGVAKLTKEGISTPGLDNIITKLNGGQMPDMFKHAKTFMEDTTQGSLGNRFFSSLNKWGYSPAQLAQAAEIYAGKMIYVKKYRETMDSVATFGGMFPELSRWTAAGIPESQAQDFVDMFRANTYDITATMENYSRKYGDGAVDTWRMLDWVHPEAKKGLKDYGTYWDEIQEMVNNPKNFSQQEVLDKIDDMKIRVRKDAARAADEPVRIDTENGKDPFSKSVMDDAELAGKYGNPDIDNALVAQKLQADHAFDAFDDAFNELMYSYKSNPSPDSQAMFQKMKTARDRVKVIRDETTKAANQTRVWAISTRDKVLKGKVNPADLWDEAILGKKKPGLITRDNFLNRMWEYYFDKRAKTWTESFDARISEYMKAAGDNREIAQLFDKANLEGIRLEQYRNYVYANGRIYTQPPAVNPAKVGDTANANNVRSIANAYGISTVGETGAGKDKAVLNIINKYAPPSATPSVSKPKTVRDEIRQFYDAGRPDLNNADNVNKVNEYAKELGVKIYEDVFDTWKALDLKVGTIDLINDKKFSDLQEMGRLAREKKSGITSGYTRLEDVPPDVAEKAFSKQTGQNIKYFMKKQGDEFVSNDLLEGLPVRPPHDPKVQPVGQIHVENKDGAISALNHIQQGIRDRWGLKTSVNPEAQSIFKMIPDLEERAAIAKAKSQIVSEKFRDFALLPYGEKTNLDFAMSLAYPYQFWYSRTYKNWMQRAFMTNPEIISRYANLKDAMAQEQKDLPDWWKSQLNVSKLLGVETDNPIYINLEAAVNPLYGLTGVDFNNPKKRVDWWTSTLDDMGKFGPSLWAPLQIATALALKAKGDEDTAAFWGTRVIPLTATAKAVSSKYFGKPVELDPAVLFFNGQMDSYEEGRVARALSEMRNEGVPEELLIEAARTRQGDLWDEAYQRATNARAAGQISSALFGVGFKGRSETDMQIDRFYADYERMRNLHDAGYMTDDQYRQAFNEMREAYPFMDIILLSRRAGDGREAAYAYNVMSRIPPGQSTAILKAAGIDPETAQKFYDSGGKFGNMTETERQHFLASMVDVGALLAIPSNTTRDEWTAVRARYNEIQALQKQEYGDDILERISDYFALKTSEEKAMFSDANPDVMDAMDFRTELIATDSVMSRYYGGLDVIERYYTSQMYDTLESKYSEETLAKVQFYYTIDLSKDRTKFKKENKDVAAYFKEKYSMQDDIARQLSKFGDLLPASPTIREDAVPSYSKQEDILNAAQPAPRYTEEQWTNMVGQPVMDLIAEFKYGDDSLPYDVRNYLEYAAGKYGYKDENDMLIAIMTSMR